MSNNVKRLRALTIIPDSLYVRRAADDQLRAVVENMGRPGYVLVARQMGKTNLLLNAKRELGGDGDVFLYVDLSNRFPTLEQFFRNIIDIAVEIYPALFSSIKSIIADGRLRNTGLPAHKEHEQELRLLLNNVDDRKIVICLDEIDALTKSPYSDSVFSLIRSTYFASRVNFEEFNRLTYILSGVAEPSEIIKNKDISPFNIGEKIYLDDFSYAEYKVFLSNANLNLSDEVAERIYYWTSGNPRMCWDTCSAVEDILSKGFNIGADIVDQTVRKLYLTSFDMAPVDHIRQLVEDDKEIRTAIMNIHFDKFSSVGDLQRTKLYLAGIVKANFLSGTVSIKNKIIEESLSVEWINSIEERKLSQRDRADAKLAASRYQEALDLYKDCENSSSSKDKVFLYHSMGECSFRLGDFAAAIDYLTRAPARKSSFATLFFRQQLWLATALIRTGDAAGSIERLNSIIYSDFDGEYTVEYYEALVNRCAPYFEDLDKYCEQVIEDCRIVIDNVESVQNISYEQSNTLKCAAFFNIAVALRKTSRLDDAISVLTEALVVASDASKLTLMVELYDIVSKEDGEKILLSAAELISRGSIAFKTEILTEQFNFTPSIYANLIIRASNADDPRIWNAIIDPLVNQQFGEESTLEVFNLSLILSVRREVPVRIHRIFKQLFLLKHNLDIEQIQAIFYYIFVIEDQMAETDLESLFLRLFSSWDVEVTSERDLVVCYVLAEKYLVLKNIPRSIEFLGLGQYKRLQLIQHGRQDLKCAFAALDFLELQMLAAQKKYEKIDSKARKLRKFLDEILDISPLFAVEFFGNMRIELDRLLGVQASPLQVRNGTKYGRNDKIRCRFIDGSVKEGKYKIFAEDLAAGNCVILGDEII